MNNTFDAGTMTRFLNAIEAEDWKSAGIHADSLRMQGWTYRRLMDAACSERGITSGDFEAAMQEIDHA